MSYIIFLLIDLNIRTQISAIEIKDTQSNVDLKINTLSVLSSVQNKIVELKNPYFEKWAKRRLQSFLKENEDFFNGTNRTNPHASDTFGIDGIKDTAIDGIIHAVSSVYDYWEDDFVPNYLSVQEQLIKTKHITIQRIFIFPKGMYAKFRKVMEDQKKIGINVYYLFSDGDYINPAWKNEDFLIQDDNLLVQINTSSMKNSTMEEQCELITINRAAVSEKREVFRQMLERAKLFG